MLIERLSIGRERAARAAGVAPGRLHAWIGREGLLPGDGTRGQRRAFTIREVMAIAVTAHLIDAGLRADVAIGVANTHDAYRALVSGERRITVGEDFIVRIEIDVAAIFESIWLRYAAQLLDCARSPEQAREYQQAAIDFRYGIDRRQKESGS